MATHEALLQAFETESRSDDNVQSLMQHVADRLHEEMARYNWVGFYLREAPAFDVLVLGPYCGSFMPIVRIPLDKGLCGAAASSGATVAVNNVSADPRYIGSDLVKSNIVVPIFAKKCVVAELCIESYFANTFDKEEQRFIEMCAALIGRQLEKHGLPATVGTGKSH